MSRMAPNPVGRVFLPSGDLPHVVDVYRNIPVRGAAGDVTPVPTILYRAVSCWIMPQQASESQDNKRLTMEITHKITMFINPGILNGDFLRWVDGKGAAAPERTLVVGGVRSPDGLNLTWIVTAREIQG